MLWSWLNAATNFQRMIYAIRSLKAIGLLKTGVSTSFKTHIESKFSRIPSTLRTFIIVEWLLRTKALFFLITPSFNYLNPIYFIFCMLAWPAYLWNRGKIKWSFRNCSWKTVGCSPFFRYRKVSKSSCSRESYWLS